MPDVQTTAAIVFLIVLLGFFILKRSQFHVQKIIFPLLYFAMYKTKLGLKGMDVFAKKTPRLLHILGNLAIFTGFVGMVFIAFTLVHNLYTLLTTPSASAGVALVLPFRVRGTFFVPFFYWIISIFILAVVHEFSHGIFARLHNIKIKSSGFAFLAVLVPILPAAFVEPDEKQLGKRTKKQQLSVFAAGPFANIVLAGVVLLISVVVAAPIMGAVVEDKGVEVTGFVEDSFPAKVAGMQEGEVITAVDDQSLTTVEEFTNILQGKKPGQSVVVHTEGSQYPIDLIEHPEDAEAAYLGVYVQQETGVQEDFAQKFGMGTANVIIWLAGLLFWLFVLNLGIGLFNLLPLGPIDGGRMLRTALQHFFDERKADKIWKNVSLVFLVLLLVNLGFAFVR